MRVAMVAMTRLERAIVNSPAFTLLHGRASVPRVLGAAGGPIAGPLLEIGCGRGATTEAIVRRLPGVAVSAIDFDPVEVDLARRRLGARALVEQADARKLPHPDASFGTVMEMNAFHHIAEWRDAVREACRVVRPGGQFLFMDYTRRAFFGALANDTYQPGRFTADEFSDGIAEAGFSPVVARGDWIVVGRAAKPAVQNR